jgi:hypothetical protein
MTEKMTITTVAGGELGVEPGQKVWLQGLAQHAEENTAKMVQLIETRLRRRGNGTSNDPVRNVVEYWSLDGEKVAEYDCHYPEPVKRLVNLEDSNSYKTRINNDLREQLRKECNKTARLQAQIDKLTGKTPTPRRKKATRKKK